MLNSQTCHLGLLYAQTSLLDHIEAINQINVFPVADNDTGTNLFHSIEDIHTLVSTSVPVAIQLQQYANALFGKASGNSGFIFAMLFSKLSERVSDKSDLSPQELGQCILVAAQFAKIKIADYVEGGIISYAETLAEFLRDSSNIQWSLALFEIIKAKTPGFLEKIAKLNPMLMKYNVVDAGALGLSHWFIGFFSALCQAKDFEDKTHNDNQKCHIEHRCEHVHVEEKPNFQYCVQATLKIENKQQTMIERLLFEAGDCNLSLCHGEKLRFHVHTDSPKALFAKLMQQSKVLELKVDDMLNQYLSVQSKHSIAIVSDSSADIPAPLLIEHFIHVIPISITHDQQKMLDGITVDTQILFEKMRASQEHPKTSTPPIGSIKKMFEFLSQTHQHVFAVSISAEMSGTFNIFNEVAQSFNNISVINSKRNSGAHGSVVTQLAQFVKEGMPYQTILENINSIIHATDIFVLVGNFKTMLKSGRVSKYKACFADLINLKPLVGLDENGKGKVLAKSLSWRKQKIQLLKQLEAKHAIKPIKALKVLHVDNLAGAQQLQNELRQQFVTQPCEILAASAAVSLHAGFGTLAVSIEQDIYL